LQGQQGAACHLADQRFTPFEHGGTRNGTGNEGTLDQVVLADDLARVDGGARHRQGQVTGADRPGEGRQQQKSARQRQRR